MGGPDTFAGVEFRDPRAVCEIKRDAEAAAISRLYQSSFTRNGYIRRVTQASKRRDKLMAKRERLIKKRNLWIFLSGLFFALFLITMGVAWFFDFNGLIVELSLLGVSAIIGFCIWYLDQ